MILKQVHLLRVCFILLLCFSIFPEVVASHYSTNESAQLNSVSAQDTNSCNEHNCPIRPNEPYHHCSVCCIISHFFTNQAAENTFIFSNTPQLFSIAENVFYRELFEKTLFRPPQSIL